VAETFEQAAPQRAGQGRLCRGKGAFDLEAAKDLPRSQTNRSPDTAARRFRGAFKAAAVTLDETYTTPDQSHAMMEPHASIAAWDGDEVTVWTSSQMIDWWRRSDLATTLDSTRKRSI
jgi:xanthine dehydrogenase YagR molybdenum-binding subunit